MRTIFTLLAFVATFGLCAQSISGDWNESHYIMGTQGKIEYDESITIKQIVNVGNDLPLQRRVRYRHGAGDWQSFPGVPDTVITQNYTFHRVLNGLSWSPYDNYTWDIDIRYVNTGGQVIEALHSEWNNIVTRDSSNASIVAFPGPYSNELYLQYAVSIHKDMGPGIDTDVNLRAVGQSSGMVYNVEVDVPDAGQEFQTVTLSFTPWYTEDICVEIWVERSDLIFYDYTDIVVGYVDVWVPCTMWDGNSTATGEKPSMPDLLPFPSPTYGSITVQELDTNEQTLDVYSLNGQLVERLQTYGLTTVTHDFSNLAAGVYTLRQNERAVRFQKL